MPFRKQQIGLREGEVAFLSLSPERAPNQCSELQPCCRGVGAMVAASNSCSRLCGAEPRIDGRSLPSSSGGRQSRSIRVPRRMIAAHPTTFGNSRTLPGNGCTLGNFTCEDVEMSLIAARTRVPASRLHWELTSAPRNAGAPCFAGIVCVSARCRMVAVVQHTDLPGMP